MSEFSKIVIMFSAAGLIGFAGAYLTYDKDPKATAAQKQAEQDKELAEIAQRNQRVQDRLPPGCTINFYGWYRYNQSYSDMPIVAVICKKQDTTNLNWRQPMGKFTRPELQFVINER